MISGNFYSTRHNILDQDHATSQFLVPLQSIAERAQALGNSLAVIEPIHAENELAAGKSGAQLFSPLRDFLRRRAFFKRLEIDADGETADADLALFDAD